MGIGRGPKKGAEGRRVQGKWSRKARKRGEGAGEREGRREPHFLCSPTVRLPLLVGRELAGVHSLAEKPFDDRRMFFHFPFTFDLRPG